MSGATAMQRVAVLRAQATAAGEVRNDSTADVTALTRAMVRGDEAAWVRFHGDYSGRLHRYLLVLLKADLETAAEVLQITFTRVARHIRRFDDEAVLWHWLTRVARTAAIDELRKRGRREESLRELAEAPEVSCDSGAEWSEVLRQALARIEGGDAELLRGKYVEGASVRELATTEGVSEKAIESRLTRARERLRGALLEVLNDEA